MLLGVRGGDAAEARRVWAILGGLALAVRPILSLIQHAGRVQYVVVVVLSKSVLCRALGEAVGNLVTRNPGVCAYVRDADTSGGALLS